MARGIADTPGFTLRSLAAAVMPWLFSSSVHMGVVLAMALSFTWSQAPRGAGGDALQVTIISSGEGTGAGEGGTALSTQVGNSEVGYYDDEQPTLDTSPAASPSQGGGNGGNAALASLLSEQPTLKHQGTLPAGGSPGRGEAQETGTGSGEGTGTGDGIGSANRLASASAGAHGMRGGNASTGVFGLRGEGQKFLYVFDRSGSMDGHGGAPLAAAKSELLESLKDLGQTHQFQIIFYNEQPRIFNPSGTSGRLVFGTDQNKHLASRFVGSITASGATRHEEALELALRLAPDVIFFLTDADEPRMTAKQLADIARRNQGTTINTIEFGYGQQYDSDNFLVKLARQNGGQHVYVDVSRLPAARR